MNNGFEMQLHNYKICKSPFSKLMGLMFSKPKRLVFIFEQEKIVSFHTFFMFYPIDILFLDKDKKIVEIKQNLKPFKFYTPKNKCKFVIELPISMNVKVGEVIEF